MRATVPVSLLIFKCYTLLLSHRKSVSLNGSSMFIFMFRVDFKLLNANNLSFI